MIILGHHIGDGIRHHKDQIFWFDLSEVPMSKNLIAAELRIYKKEKDSEDYQETEPVTLMLHQIKGSPGGR